MPRKLNIVNWNLFRYFPAFIPPAFRSRRHGRRRPGDAEDDRPGHQEHRRPAEHEPREVPEQRQSLGEELRRQC